MKGLDSKSSWNIAKGKIKQAAGELTGNASTYMEGVKDEATGRIQKELGKSEAEAEAMIRRRP